MTDKNQEAIKKDFTVGVKLGGVFSSGAFENLKPFFDFSVTYKEVESFPTKQFEKDMAEAEIAHKKTYECLYKQLEYCEKQANQKAIEKFHKNIRWYETGENGTKYPSVTSVIDFANPIEWHVDEFKKRGLAARGMIVDIVLQEYIKDGVWKMPEDIPEAIRHLGIMKEAGYAIEGNLPGFVEKYEVKFGSGHRKVLNHKYRYGGEPDAYCTFGNDPSRVLVDLKSFNPDEKGKIRTLKQTAAYAMASEDVPEKIGIVPIHGKTKQGFSQPIITDKIDEYFQMFLSDRKVFKDTFGI